MTTSSLDILRAYLEINEIIPQQYILVAWSVLEAHPDWHIINYAKKWYIITYFQQFLQGKLSLEKFMGIGDWDSTLTIFEHKTYLKWWSSAKGELHQLEQAHWSVQWVLVLLDQIWAEYMQSREPDAWKELEKEVAAAKGRIIILDSFVYTAPAGETDPYEVRNTQAM